jgi:stage II sporulation protein D
MMTCRDVKRKALLRAILIMAFLPGILLLMPGICRAGQVKVQLVWKFPESYWLEFEVRQGSYTISCDQTNLNLESGDQVKLGRSGLFRFLLSGNELRIITEPELRFAASEDGVFRIREPEKDWVSYRGSMTASTQGMGWKLTNILDREDYLKGVVPIEMSNAWAVKGMEALKAQAVAARTYLLKNMDENNTITDSPDIHQAYGGRSAEGDAGKAVEATRGEILADSVTGQPISVFYSSNNGGYSEGTEHVWQNHDPHYLAKPDPFSLGIGGLTAGWRFLIAADALGESFGMSPVREIALKKYPSGRVCEIALTDWLDNRKTVTGGEFVRTFYPYDRELTVNSFLGRLFEVDFIYPAFPISADFPAIPGAFNPRLLESASQQPALSRLISSNEGFGGRERNFGVFVFKGRGWGHGVGMSQWGAYNMALNGYSYRDILDYYYHQTTLVKID